MRRYVVLAFMVMLFAVVWGQPHILTGTVQLQEGGIPDQECLYITITVGGDDYYITPESTDLYDETEGRWHYVVDMSTYPAGTGITVSAVDSCWYEDGTIYGIVSDSFSTDVGLLTLTEIAGLRPILYDAYVDPTSGYVEDNFYFQVSYESDPWNRAPSVFELYIDDVLAANASAVDPGDNFYIDGADFFAQLTGATITRGYHIFYFYCEDALGLPAWSDTFEFSVLNHPPVLLSASLSASPDPAVETSIITCTPGTATDGEGDVITYEYNWFVNGSSVGVTTNTLNGDYFDKGDEVWCEVTPYDGWDYGDAVESDHIFIQNTAPEAPEIAIFPENPFDFEDIGVVITAPSFDVDGDDITYSYEWYRDGELISTAEVLTNDLTTTGDIWTLRVTPNDGEVDGEFAELEFTIGGPVLSDGYVEPTSGHPLTTDFTYYVIYTNARNYQPGYVLVDIDGVNYNMLPVNPTDTNYIDGATYYYATTLVWGEHQFRFSAMDDRGDVAIGMEEYIDGPDMTNTPPVVDEVAISPEPTATELDVLTASVISWHDDDGDDVTFTYQWYVNDEVVDGATAATLDGDYFDKGDEVYCEITPHDAYSDGAPVNTATVTIVNSPPYADYVDILVAPLGGPTELSTLTAAIINPGDPDEDELTYTYEWFVNGSPLGLDPTTDHIDGEYFDRGNDVFVQVTISDGEDETVLTSATITIGNALPVITDFGIVPENPYTDDDLSVALDYNDPDGDDVLVQYLWWRNYEFVGNDATISSDLTSHFDTWVVEVRLSDGFVEGEYVSDFDTVQILNSVPEIGEFIDTFAVGGGEYMATIPATDLDDDVLGYEVIEGPDGMRILDDGTIVWEVPEIDTLETYDVVISVSDGFDEAELEYTLWVYPISHAVFAPVDLDAEGGYVGMIPLVWTAPAAFDVFHTMPTTFVGYEVWRATNPDPEIGDWTMIGETYVPNFIDLDVDAYQIYYYYVVAVYEVGTSAQSNIDNAFSIEGELTSWYSNFSFSAAPIIDGVINAGEWADAMTYVMGNDSIKVHFKHTNGYLYIGVENIADDALTANDMLMVSIDDNNNNRWPSGSPSDEGEYRVKAVEGGIETTYQGIWGIYPDGITRDVRGTYEGLMGAASDEAGFVSYELAIPIGDELEDINLPGLGSWIGFRLAVYDVDSYDWDLIQPTGSDPEDPESFGQLYLEIGANPGALCLDPTELEMTLREGEIRSMILQLCNCGEGYLSYDITESCSPDPFAGGLMRTTSADIVAYVDDESLVPQALAILGYAYDSYTDAVDFLSAVAGGGYKLVIVSADDVSAPEIWSAVRAAYDNGIAILIQTPDLDEADDSTIAALGLARGEDLGDRGCALTWDIPTHPFFHTPMEVPSSVERIEGDFDDYGDNLNPGEYSVLASFDLYPYPINAAIVHDAEDGIIVNSFRMSNLNDTDEDGIVDGVELLVNEIWNLKPCADVAWLSENPTAGVLAVDACQEVSVVFDATDLTAGDYYAYLSIRTNDPTNPLVYVPCHMIVNEPEERILSLSFPEEAVEGCKGSEIIVPITVASLEEMNITQLQMTVSVDPSIAQPTDVDVLMGELGDLSAGPGSLTFTVQSEDPILGDGVIAMVHFDINDDVVVGTMTTLGISGVSYNYDAYVTDVYTYPGQLRITSCEDTWRLNLEFQVFGERVDEIEIGVDPDGTNAFDEGLDEENDSLLGAWFDVWSDISLWDAEHPALSVDIRDADADEIHWYIETGDSAGKMEWTFDDGVDLTDLGSIYLYCGDDVVDMKTVSIYYYDAEQDIEIVYRLSGAQPFTYHFDAGYTMISLPLQLDSYLVDDIFPDNFGCWYYDTDMQTWAPASVISPGVGYVVLFLTAKDITLWGTPVSNLELNLVSGWNLIGTVYDNVDFTVPDVDPEGALFGSPEYAWYYDGSTSEYVLRDELIPGQGYFVAALEPCVLYLPGESGSGKKTFSEEPLWTGKILVGGEELEIGVGAEKMVPVPPTMMRQKPAGAYISKGDWKLFGEINPDAKWTLVIEEDAVVKFDIPDNVHLTIDGNPAADEMTLSAGTYKLASRAIPAHFALKQNVPNPFNASTKIEFALPKESDVNISVYDVSGHLVKTLVDGRLSAGYYDFVWNGADDSGRTIGSGLYFCRMTARNFSAVRRMVIVK
ncbi:T9SS type A sorting domain-containing protein [bacterium]|nr:T9SS type A sorting domain-containing protein [bacterium]